MPLQVESCNHVSVNSPQFEPLTGENRESGMSTLKLYPRLFVSDKVQIQTVEASNMSFLIRNQIM